MLQRLSLLYFFANWRNLTILRNCSEHFYEFSSISSPSSIAVSYWCMGMLIPMNLDFSAKPIDLKSFSFFCECKNVNDKDIKKKKLKMSHIQNDLKNQVWKESYQFRNLLIWLAVRLTATKLHNELNEIASDGPYSDVSIHLNALCPVSCVICCCSFYWNYWADKISPCDFAWMFEVTQVFARW